MAMWADDGTGTRRGGGFQRTPEDAPIYDPATDPLAGGADDGPPGTGGGAPSGGDAGGEPDPGDGTKQPPASNPSPVTATGAVAPWTGTGQMASNYYVGQGSRGGRGTNSTDYTYQQAYTAIQQAYRELLGRDASAAEIQAQIQGQGWQQGDRWVGMHGLNSVLNSIWSSPEALQFRATQQAVGGDPGTPPGDTTDPGDAGGGGDDGSPAPAGETLFDYGGVATEIPAATVNPAGGGPAGPTPGPSTPGTSGLPPWNRPPLPEWADWTAPDMPTVGALNRAPLPELGEWTAPEWTAPAMPDAPEAMEFDLSNPASAEDNYARLMASIGSYDPATFTQFTAPEQGGYENQLMQALSHALGNSEWSPERMAAMKETQKEQALEQQAALGDQLGNRFAASGRLGSGAHVGALSDVGQATNESILGSYRDINEQGAQGRRNELLTTANALDAALTGQMGRATAGYASTLGGQTAQAEENRAAHESQQNLYDLALRERLGEGELANARQGMALEQNLGLGDLALRQALGQGQLNLDAMLGLGQMGLDEHLGRGRLNLDAAIAGQQLDLDELLGRGRLNLDASLGGAELGLREHLGQQQYGLDRALGGAQLDLDELLGRGNLDLQERLGMAGVGVDQARLGESGRQFDLSHALAIAQFLENQRQGNNSLGYNYAALNSGLWG